MAVRSGVDVVAVLSPVGAPVGYAWEADPLAAEGGCDDSVCLFPRAPFDAVSFRVWPADDPATYGVSVLELPAPEPEVTLSPGYVVHDLRLSRASLLDPRGPFVEIAVDVPAAGTWKVGAESREGERRVELEVVSATIPWDFVPLNVLGSHTYNATWFSTDGPGRVVVRLTTCPRCLPQTVDAEVQEAEAPF